MDHLALAVRDQERSRRFYETYLGFDVGPAQRYSDGVLIIRNAEGFACARAGGRGAVAAAVPPLWDRRRDA
jgi:catechol 2,3-dioxygenase-like lactoylglutathione lyase family enzyme